MTATFVPSAVRSPCDGTSEGLKAQQSRRSQGVVSLLCDRTLPTPIYQQIYEGIRDAVLGGRLIPGQRIPSTRTLARLLHVSRIPVYNAFEQLVSEGYLEGRPGSGTYVAMSIPDEVTAPIIWITRPARLPHTAAPLPRDPNEGNGIFRVGTPALDCFPRAIFASLIHRHARGLTAECMADGDPAGYLPLREAIAEYLRSTRAVECDAGQVLVVSGSTMGIRISAMAIAQQDSVVGVEDPGNTVARDAFRTVARVIPVAVDDEGIDVQALKRIGDAVDVVCVTPACQYPLGVSMSVPRRIELTDWAARRGGWIVEDDRDSAFRHGGRALSALQGMDGCDRVVYVGSFSTVLFPALRLGYVVAPRSLISSFTRTRETFDRFAPALPQLILNDFIREGHLGRHVRRMRSVYLARRDALIGAIRREASDVLTVGDADFGIHLLAYLPDDADDEAVVRCARQRGMFPTALSSCYAGSSRRRGLILGFGGWNESRLREAIREIAVLIRSTR